MPDVFLSYSREDQTTARRFAEGLQREGFSVWWDQALNAGEAFDRVTEKALDEARAVVVLWSKHSVDSDWVRAEATQARATQRLVPVMIEPCRRPIMFELTHTADLAEWNGDTSDARWRSFVAGLAGFTGKPATAPASATSAPPAAGSPRRASRKPLAWAAGAAVLAIAAALLWSFRAEHRPAPVAVVDASIAVLPFDDMSPGRDQEYFADGVAEEILNSLARLPDVKVTGRNSSFAFKGRKEDLRAIGQTLGVAHLLEGSVRKAGDQLRITAQLIRSDTGFNLWSRTYDRPLTDVFAVQEEIARSVAEALQVTLGVGFGRRPGMTRDVEAFDAYLQAQALWPRFTADTRRRGVELLERAVARDPGFALAWYELATVAASMPSLIGTSASEDEAQAWLRKSGIAFGEFERLMQGTPELHAGLGGRSVEAGRLAEAAEHFEVAGATPRASTEQRSGPALLSLMVGRSRQAAAQLEQEKARDPLSPIVANLLVHAYGNVGEFEAAMAEAERAYGLGGGARTVASAAAITQALGEGNRAQILQWLDAGAATGTPDPVAPDFNARMKQLLDKPAEAMAYLQMLAQDPSATAVTLSAVAVYQAYFGEPEAALQSLRLVHARGLPIVANLTLWNPIMRDARRLPEFKQVARDFGLVDYWKKYGWADLCKPVGADDFECS